MVDRTDIVSARGIDPGVPAECWQTECLTVDDNHTWPMPGDSAV